MKWLLLICVSLILNPALGFAEVTDAHIGHSLWFTDYGTSSHLLITGDTAERAYNDMRSVQVDDTAEHTVKRFGPMLCTYSKVEKYISPWEWLKLLFNSWGTVDFRYVCDLNPMP